MKLVLHNWNDELPISIIDKTRINLHLRIWYINSGIKIKMILNLDYVDGLVKSKPACDCEE